MSKNARGWGGQGDCSEQRQAVSDLGFSRSTFSTAKAQIHEPTAARGARAYKLNDVEHTILREDEILAIVQEKSKK